MQPFSSSFSAFSSPVNCSSDINSQIW
jgi:hypothetical protein